MTNILKHSNFNTRFKKAALISRIPSNDHINYDDYNSVFADDPISLLAIKISYIKSLQNSEYDIEDEPEENLQDLIYEAAHMGHVSSIIKWLEYQNKVFNPNEVINTKWRLYSDEEYKKALSEEVINENLVLLENLLVQVNSEITEKLIPCIAYALKVCLYLNDEISALTLLDLVSFSVKRHGLSIRSYCEFVYEFKDTNLPKKVLGSIESTLCSFWNTYGVLKENDSDLIHKALTTIFIAAKDPVQSLKYAEMENQSENTSSEQRFRLFIAYSLLENGAEKALKFLDDCLKLEKTIDEVNHFIKSNADQFKNTSYDVEHLLKVNNDLFDMQLPF